MLKRPPKQKRQKLSKEQIAQQLAMQQEAERFKILIREDVWPALQKTDSAYAAQKVAEIFKTVMQGKMNDYWTDKKVADLALIDQMNEEGEFPNKAVFMELAEALAELSIADCQKLLQGMASAFDGYGRRLVEQTKMADLPVTEIINE